MHNRKVVPARIGDFVRRLGNLRPPFGRKLRRRSYELELVTNSGLFDPDWYLQTYPDIAEAKIDPLHHFMEMGWRERRNPGPEFSTSAYLKENPDVAAADVNPLLHLLEFGYFEGRGTSENRRAAPQRRRKAAGNFGPPAPCISIPLPERAPTRWQRSHRLNRARSDLLWIGNHPVGYCNEEAIRKVARSSFSLLKQLSGQEQRRPISPPTEPTRGGGRLLDAWYVNASQLRTRWESDDFPLVVRAFQPDPLRGGALFLAAEGIVESPVDVLDVHLRNPLFPALFVFAAPDGVIRDARVLAFPSLCRGGIHYPEWLRSTVAPGAPTDVFALGESMGSRLLRLLNGDERAAISRIDVEISDADGRGPLFQSAVRQWLEGIIKIAVEPVARAERTSVQCDLAEAVRLAPEDGRDADGASLILGGDMLPTIGALTECHEMDESRSEETGIPLIVSGAEVDRPKILIEVPMGMLPSRRNRFGHASEWPRLNPASGRPLARTAETAAIALPNGKDLSDAELFLPAAHGPAQESGEQRAAICWIIETRGWPNEALAEAVHALSLQTGNSNDRLTFIGAPDPLGASVACEQFRGRLTDAASVSAAVVAATTPLVGFVGAGIVFHDNHTADELASLLLEQRIATASCVIIHAKYHRRGRQVPVTDGGALAAPRGATLGRTEYGDAVAYLWRSHYPVLAPSAQVWLARNACLKEWIEAPESELGDRFHICTSSVTASQLARQTATSLPPFIPTAPQNRVTRVQALFG